MGLTPRIACAIMVGITLRNKGMITWGEGQGSHQVSVYEMKSSSSSNHTCTPSASCLSTHDPVSAV